MNSELSYRCSSCKNLIKLNDENVKQIEAICNGKTLYVTKVICSCGHEMIVQLDDCRTKSMLKEIVKMMIDTSKTIKKMGCRTKKQSAQLKNLNNMIDYKRKKLVEQYNGESVREIKTNKVYYLDFGQIGC